MTQKQELQKLREENAKLIQDNRLMKYAIYVCNKITLEIK